MTRARLFHALAGLCLALWLAGTAHAQDAGETTALVADLVRIDGNERLIAEGNVEVFTRGRRLRASRIVYDRSTDRVQIDGPIELRDADGTVVLADAAELDTDLTEGILQGARVVLNDQLQIAGAEMTRRGGRFSDLRQVAASSCQVCARGQTPLWEIRADRVIHDQETAQVYFYNARFRIAGVPVFYLPALRVPDGSDPRVRGFLPPSFVASSSLGNGIRLPWFLPLGDHADVTLIPYVTEDDSTTLEARYRQAFVRGDLLIEGAASEDRLESGTRGYLFATQTYALPNGFNLTADVELTSDDAYLRDYGFSDKDRLDSAIAVSRVRPGELIAADITHFQSLRADSDDSGDPDLVAYARWDQRMQMPGVGGWFDFDLAAQAFRRESAADIDGRDMAQLRGRAGWRNTYTGPGGLRLAGEADLTLDLKRITDDSRFETTQAGLWPQGALTLSWPLIRPGAGGSYQILEPVAQIAHSADSGIESPNDDSTAVALDTGNILSLNRFPGLDRSETGTRANLALRWSARDTDGVRIALTGGRIYRFSDTDQFSASSGLAGRRSDWLAQVDLDIADEIRFRTLALLDDDLDLSIFEARLGWNGPGRLVLASNYIWQSADRDANLTEDVSEVYAAASLPLTRTWSARGELRRDFTVGRTNRSGLVLAYANECVRVDLSVTRRFRATNDVEATTTYGFTVELAGFGSAGGNPAAAGCRN
ncbi:LPS-assembly protein LptD [Meridianimarinicoccus sp. RP-17]|uniref:LPS-assembly protein LptD n=1 Tax=Meridianimarinicoccus zhengii TaxID=2056810 RepID=UPI000DADA944|nr:LPS assembly protein LptD [Phycocomes zhengii]